ncbi:MULTISPECIES: fibrobacter succinogenes major paralogous domain-containing protein [unclassified Vibrio]|uniref:Fibrobacter succinogenes major paralogous domain-containing protein n=1 Tax=Vibrio sp. HB236076 TaxID=3232307 RepID=A0AB39HK58_9VIBR|nr:fibrobacter succinogenes major paralogous domain-containing protein [Vibrio sp. HB161653]MDP5252925.1 fibrobacter succinogenes major paralogous domain-containing protein [Vibrio sp. HB161653]
MNKLLLSTGVTMVLSVSAFANDIHNTRNALQDSVQDVEGNVYRTVTIGDQVWLAENLRSTTFQDGSAVRTGAIVKDDPANLLKYGRLYNWHDVADERNLCPEGWRVATDDDWKTLERTLGMSDEELDQEGWRGGEQDLGLQLKEAQADGPFKKIDQSLLNKHHFSARPAGVKWHGWYITQGAYTEFWTASSASESKGRIRTLAYSWWNAHKGEIRRSTSSKEYLFSVRCVKR